MRRLATVDWLLIGTLPILLFGVLQSVVHGVRGDFVFPPFLVPAQRMVRPRIDRLLFPERVTLQQGFEHLLAELSNSADMRALTRLVNERLDALLRRGGGDAVEASFWGPLGSRPALNRNLTAI